jgi:Transcriptional regulators of sugar metabolism
MYSIERKAEILKLLEQNGRVDVNELSSLLQASRETIRRDLSELEENGALKRTHGGAVFGSINPKTVDEFPVAVREIQQFKEKDAICQRAAAFIEDGDSLFVDNSSTCIYLLKYIPPEYHVTIITNSIKVMLEAAKNRHANHMLVCLGGAAQRKQPFTVWQHHPEKQWGVLSQQSFHVLRGNTFPGRGARFQPAGSGHKAPDD